MSTEADQFASSYADEEQSSSADVEMNGADAADQSTGLNPVERSAATRLPLSFEDAMKPAVSPEAYSLAIEDVPQQVAIGDGSEMVAIEASPETEQLARGWFHDAGASQFEAQELTATYLEEMRHGFTDERREVNRAAALELVGKQHGARSEEAILAAQRVVREMEERQPGLVAFLETTGLGNHPHIVSQFIRRAKTLGYLR
jgi:hypothetical protein